jgi:hypothetical protein
MSPKPGDRDASQSRTNDLKWYKSSRSSFNGNCVEAARLPHGNWAVRDSKNKDGGILLFGADEWRTFVTSIKTRKFDV